MPRPHFSALDREVRLAFWKVHILHHAGRGPVCGLWLQEELARHGHKLRPGTLYPILARMTANGWLKAEPQQQRDKARREYTLTPLGEDVLGALCRDLSELHAEVMASRRPAELPPGG